MCPYESLAQMQIETAAPLPVSPAERVLKLAENLPHTREALIREADRTEMLLENLPNPTTEVGMELTQALAEVFEAQIQGIDGLLAFDETGDEALLEQSLALLVESAHGLEEIEAAADSAREEMPLVA